MDFTFLSKDDILGDKSLETIQKYGERAAPTDLVAVTGGFVAPSGYRTCEGEYTTRYWTGSPNSYKDQNVLCVEANGKIITCNQMCETVAARPIIIPEETERIIMMPKKKIKGINVVNFGEYPQMFVGELMSVHLEKIYQSGSLDRTGRVYHLGADKHSLDEIACEEYKLNDRRFVRIEGFTHSKYTDEAYLFTGERVKNGKIYWIEVKPIEWFEDKSGIFISKKCLFTGIPINKRGKDGSYPEAYKGDFSETYMKHFLDKYFAYEIGEDWRVTFRVASKSATRDFTKPSRGWGISGAETSKKKDEEPVIWGSGAPKKADIRDYDKPDDEACDEDYDEPERKEPVKKKEPSMRQKKYGIEVSEEPMSVKDQINFYIQNGMSFMLHGPSGVGKSQRVKEIDPNLTSIMLCNGILPEDVIGKTIYPNGGNEGTSGGVWVAPKWYDDLCKKCKNEPNKQHVLFIDEVTNARETTQSLIYHVALEKTIAQGVGQLPDNSVVVLAGNSKEESGAAYNMPAPLFRRLSHIYLDLNIKDWLEWGSEKSKKHPEDPERLNIHPIISSFVATYGKQVFYSEYDEEDPKKFALDPRKWEKVSDKIYAGKGVIRREILEADIGRELAAHLLEYAKNPPLTLEEVVEGEYSRDDIPEVQDAKLALALSLRHASPKQVKKVRKFIEKNLGAENRAIFDSVWVGNDDSKAIQLAVMQNRTGER